MDEKRRSDALKSSNLLLSGGRGGFSLEDITASPLLVPVTENSPSVLTSDVDLGPSKGPSKGPPPPPQGGFTSALFGSLPAGQAGDLAHPPVFASPQGLQEISGLADTFGPVPLEPTFYNPADIPDYGAATQPQPLQSPSAPPLTAFPRQPSSDLHFASSPASPLTTATSFESTSSSAYTTPTGPPGPPPGPPSRPPPGVPSNAFRLGSRRPVYAPVPGLETSGTAILPGPTLSAALPPTFAPSYPAVMAPTSPPSVDSQTDPFNSRDYFEPQVSMSSDQSPATVYRAVYQHWFYKKEVENKVIWHPFSMSDSLALESKFLSSNLSAESEVSTDGGRYDVNILRRQRVAVYWEEAPTEVRRCSWFYKGNSDGRYVPYDENDATKFEEEYKLAYTQNDWQRRMQLPNGESVVFHSVNVLVHYLSSTSPDTWGNTPGGQHRHRIMKRGVDEFDIESGEPETPDHLLFIVHGVGSSCDLKFRSLVEVVDDFRAISQQLVESHFSSSVESGNASRIEVLPVSWHAKLHSEDIERQLGSITLPSIPKFRNLTNDTLIDILFYTSPIYCQTIIETVAKELNRLYTLFLERNPDFNGRVSLCGHSLGSLILFDLLWHQKIGATPSTPNNSPSTPPIIEDSVLENISRPEIVPPVSPMKRRLSHKVSFVMMGPAGTGQPYISYPQLTFHPENFFALGSPIGVFVTVRGIDKLGEEFQLPTCPSFFNIFHPYDLVAYRIETLVKPDMERVPPVLIPHHKGRKRLHLELKETVARMGADFKQRVLDSVKNTWNSVYQLAMFHRSNDTLTEEMNQVLEDEMKQRSLNENPNFTETEADLSIVVGKLNGGRRIDYVLQEAPLESFSEYLAAITSHVVYWKSEDTVLLMLKEMYRSIGVNADSQVPQQHIIPPVGVSSASSPSETLNVYTQVLSSSEPAFLEPSPLIPHTTAQQLMGMDPTAPPSDNRVVGPPPVSGFYRK